MKGFESSAKKFRFDEAENENVLKLLSVRMTSLKRCFRMHEVAAIGKGGDVGRTWMQKLIQGQSLWWTLRELWVNRKGR